MCSAGALGTSVLHRSDDIHVRETFDAARLLLSRMRDARAWMRELFLIKKGIFASKGKKHTSGRRRNDSRYAILRCRTLAQHA
jgi:hypothetical protein